MTVARSAMLIPADGRKDVVLFSYSNGLEDWKQIVWHSNPVHSGIFDVVRTPDFDVWVDDEGLYAQPLVRNLRLELLLSEYGELAQILAGDAIITGIADEEGETLNVPPEVVAKILAVTA